MNIEGDILFAMLLSSLPRWFDVGIVDSSVALGKTLTIRGLKTLGRSSSTRREELRFVDTKVLLLLKFASDLIR
jgi:hypothetical protein